MATATLDYRHLLSEKLPSAIHKEREHKHWLSELEPLMVKDHLTSAEKRFAELLTVLIEDYEKKAFPPSTKADPVDALRELMTEQGEAVNVCVSLVCPWPTEQNETRKFLPKFHQRLKVWPIWPSQLSCELFSELN